MQDSTRYFQLAPEILVEYNYNNLMGAVDQYGDVSDRIVDFEDDAYVVDNKYCSNRTFFCREFTDVLDTLNADGNRITIKRDVSNNFVLPVNKSESKFAQGSKNHVFNRDFDFHMFSPSTGNDDMTDDMLVDRFRLHFTSKNYFGSYDGYIITVHIYDGLKNKIGLLSQLIRRTDDVNININPALINQKLYTTYRDFIIPNISALISAETISNQLPGALELKNTLFPKRTISTNYDILKNSPVMMSIYGVKSTYEVNGYENYNVEKINTIYIPIVDKSNEMSIHVGEAADGDYFEIYPEIDNRNLSFSDYIYNLSDGHPEHYIVFYELTLHEHYTDLMNVPHDDMTHREQYIINAAQQIDDNGDTVLEINEKELDSVMYYRPVLKHSGRVGWFTIDVRVNIINTFDNTTIVKKISVDYGTPVDDPQTVRNQNSIIVGDPKKYGKRMNKIYLGDVPAQVNVYNKKPDLDTDTVRITNASSNVKIENHQHSVIGFIECANVGVTIEQIPKEVLQ